MITRPDEEDRDITWDDLLAAYTEWFDATVERLGGIEKFIFRVAHRARRLDSRAERPTLWMAAMSQLSRRDLTASVTGYATERGAGVSALPAIDPLIREAVTLLLDGTDRAGLTPRARTWDSASKLVNAITESVEYSIVDTSALRLVARIENGMALYRGGRPDEALPELGAARRQIHVLIEDQTERIREHETSGLSGGRDLHLIRDRLHALSSEVIHGYVRSLISRGDYEWALETIDHETVPDGPGTGVKFYIPSEHSATALDFTYWRNDWRGLATEVFDTVLLKNEILLLAMQGEVLARTGKVKAAVELWTKCLDSAEECAELSREDIAADVAGNFQMMTGVRSMDFAKLVSNSRGLMTLERALAMRRKYHSDPRNSLRSFGVNGWREEPASDIEIEINELEVAFGNRAPGVAYALSLARLDNGDVIIADSMLERAAHNSEPLAQLEMGIRHLDAGDDHQGLKYLEEAAEDENAGEAINRICEWSIENGDDRMLRKWGVRLLALLEKERGSL